jgi:predicted dehydrogenase
MYKALVIGCGNIGALYDYNNEMVQTHVKAFYLDPHFSLSIFDLNTKIIEKISNRYKCDTVNVIDVETLKMFDCISICTPTDTHVSLLKTALNAGVRVIICEKPISNNLNELNEAKTIYRNGGSKILVNFLRRFQPSFIDLKETVSNLVNNELLTNINIRYQRGFINNCSHAFDTIEFLTGSEIDLTEIKKHNIIYDHFKGDPTLSLQANWNGSNLIISGLSNIHFSLFEIDLYFEYHRICIKNAGQNIEFYKAEKEKRFLNSLIIQDQFTREECLKNYMANVIKHVYYLLDDNEQKDNFLQSISLNQRMLKLISC